MTNDERWIEQMMADGLEASEAEDMVEAFQPPKNRTKYGREVEYAPLILGHDDQPSHRVAVSLEHQGNTGLVFWSRRCNSYVVCVDSSLSDYDAPWQLPDGKRAALFSIHGNGEIRWSVQPPYTFFDPEQEEGQAVDYFQLTKRVR